MSYIRVIPRDLFNDANLLKCLGQVYLNLEVLNIPGVSLEHDGEAFDIHQDASSGATSVSNISLLIGENGDPYLNSRCFYFYRPMNSREPWPLVTAVPNDDDEWQEIAVFDNDGTFSAEMMAFLKRY